MNAFFILISNIRKWIFEGNWQNAKIYILLFALNIRMEQIIVSQAANPLAGG